MPGTLDKDRPSYLNLHQKKKVHTVAKSDIMENISTLRRRDAIDVRGRILVSEENGIKRRPARVKSDKDVKLENEVEQLIEMRKRVNILEKEVHNIKVKRDVGNRELKVANEELQELKSGMETMERRVKRYSNKTDNADIRESIEIEDSAESENRVKTLEEENRALKSKLKRRDAELKRMNSQKISHNQEPSHSKEEKSTRSKEHKASQDKEHKPSLSKDHKPSHSKDNKQYHSKEHKPSHGRENKETKSQVEDGGCNIQ